MTPTKKRSPREEFIMPNDYPVVTLDQAVADGTTPWTLNCVASRLQYRYPRHADQLRCVARQLAANDNRRDRKVA